MRRLIDMLLRRPPSDEARAQRAESVAIKSETVLNDAQATADRWWTEVRRADEAIKPRKNRGQ